MTYQIPNEFQCDIQSSKGRANMAYTFGNTFAPGKWTAPVVTLDTKNAYVGFRAFARNEAGRYVEVFEYAQEQAWVDGTNEGAWSHSTFETKADASREAWKAYRYMNKERAGA